MEMPKASVVVLNWNGGCESCLESVESALSQNYPNKEVIFVDNASADGSGRFVQQVLRDRITYIQSPVNIGCPAGRNIGARYATGDYLFFLENDGVWAEPDLITRAIEVLEGAPDIAAIYTRVDGFASGRPDAPVDPGCSHDAGLQLSSSFRGGASIIRRQAFERVGLFPEDFFRQCEERHVSLLFWDLGYKVAYWPHGVMRHRGSDYLGKKRTVLKESFQNELLTLMRLYPLYEAVTVGCGKYIVWLARMTAEGLVSDALNVTLVLMREVAAHRRRPIRPETFKIVESLRQGWFTDRSNWSRSLAELQESAIRQGALQYRIRRMLSLRRRRLLGAQR